MSMECEYDWCLCFSEEKGFYKKTALQISSDDKILLRSHANKGYKTIKTVLPGENIQIVVKTNLGYAGASYMYATIIKEGRLLLDFDTEKLYTLCNARLEDFCVKQGDWNALFDKIIKVLNSREVFTQNVVEYIESLASFSVATSIRIKRNMHCSFTLWNTEFLIILHFGNKLKNLIANLSDQSVVHISDKILIVCSLWLNKLNSMLKEIDLNDSRILEIAKTMHIIYEYMSSKGIRTDFLQLS